MARSTEVRPLDDSVEAGILKILLAFVTTFGVGYVGFVVGKRRQEVRAQGELELLQKAGSIQGALRDHAGIPPEDAPATRDRMLRRLRRSRAWRRAVAQRTRGRLHPHRTAIGISALVAGTLIGLTILIAFDPQPSPGSDEHGPLWPLLVFFACPFLATGGAVQLADALWARRRRREARDGEPES